MLSGLLVGVNHFFIFFRKNIFYFSSRNRINLSSELIKKTEFLREIFSTVQAQ